MDIQTLTDYENYVHSLEHIVFNHVGIKLAIFKGFHESLSSDKEKVTIAFPVLFVLFDSLQVDCVMTISKLIEGERGKKSIQRFLGFVDSNKKKIRKKYSGLTDDLVEKNLQQLEEVKINIQNILTQRDKYFAHADPEYFLEPNKLGDDFPDTYEDLVDILNSLQSIVNSH